MKRAALTFVVALALAGGARADPTVVELYQSQGCSSCPPADANVNAIAGAPNLLVLSFGVTYWDQLGWKDTFASPRFTARQWAYAHGLRHDDVATPEVVINGRRDVEGADPRQLYAAIRAGRFAARRQPGRDRRSGCGRRRARPARRRRRLARPLRPARPQRRHPRRRERRQDAAASQRGARAGPAGGWTGAASGYPLPRAADPNWKTAILVQAPDGGPILAAAKL